MGEAHHANCLAAQRTNRGTTKVVGARGRSPPINADRRVPVCVNNGRSPSRKLFGRAADKQRDDKGRGGPGAEPPDKCRPPSPGLREQWAKPLTQTVWPRSGQTEGRQRSWGP